MGCGLAAVALAQLGRVVGRAKTDKAAGTAGAPIHWVVSTAHGRLSNSSLIGAASAALVLAPRREGSARQVGAAGARNVSWWEKAIWWEKAKLVGKGQAGGKRPS